MKRLANEEYLEVSFGLTLAIPKNINIIILHYIIVRPNISFSMHITDRILVFSLNSSVMVYKYLLCSSISVGNINISL